MFVIYRISSTVMVGSDGHSMSARTFKFAGNARKACDKLNDRHLKNGSFGYGPGPYGWCSADHYQNRVVRMVTRVNMMSKKEYQEPSNTPNYCSPSSEAYWSM